MKKKMLNKTLVFAVMALFFWIGVCPSTGQIVGPIPLNMNGDTLYVGGSGPGNYSNIQEAIDAANDGDTIFVYKGTYSSFTVNKQLTIIGENREETVVQLGWSDTSKIILISDDIELTNFTVKGNPENVDNMLEIRGSYCDVLYCTLVPASNNMPLNGIEVGWCSYTKISNCDIIGFPYWAITCRDVANCYIENCTIGNSYRGVYTMGPNEHVYVINCEIYNCGWDDYMPSGGIFLDCSDYNHIINCDIHDNAIGIVALSLHGYNGHNDIINNNFYYNKYGIKILDGCNNNFVHHNNFVNSISQQAYDIGNNNIWDNGYPSGGNYWYDYTGVDANGDDIGDTPYNIPDGNSQDRYPLMSPYGGFNVPPKKPIISGPTAGKPGTSYEYKFNSTDPNGDQVSYYIDWGDGSNSGWLGPYPSGVQESNSHTWSSKGIYTVKVKAKDIYGAESVWSDSLPVRMPLNLQISKSNSQKISQQLSSQLLLKMVQRLLLNIR